MTGHVIIKDNLKINAVKLDDYPCFVTNMIWLIMTGKKDIILLIENLRIYLHHCTLKYNFLFLITIFNE